MSKTARPNGGSALPPLLADSFGLFGLFGLSQENARHELQYCFFILKVSYKAN